MNNKKFLALFSLLIILAFIGYIIYDTARSPIETEDKTSEPGETVIPDQWRISQELFIREGLKAVTVSADGYLYFGGDSFVACYDKDLKEVWDIGTSEPITAVSSYGDTVFASTVELVYLIGTDGKLIGEWGPYESNCIITSLSANTNYLAVADAGNKRVLILKRNGEVFSMAGQFEKKFLIPSPYFDVYLTDDNTLFLV